MGWIIQMTLVWIFIHYAIRAIDFVWRVNKEHKEMVRLNQQQKPKKTKLPDYRPYNFNDYQKGA